MTELEMKVSEAWGLMVDHAMPAKIALGFVEETTDGNGPRALEAILTQAVAHIGNSRPVTDDTPPEWHLAAGKIAGQIVQRQTEEARGERAKLARSVGSAEGAALAQGRHDLVATTGLWFEWLATVERVIGLAGELTSAVLGKVYRGNRGPVGLRTPDGTPTVMVDGKPLSPKPSQNIRNHSPDGFNWGYGGSGPAQLALAILLDVTRNAEVAQDHYQNFKRQFVAGWGDTWQISEAEVRSWLADEVTRDGGS